ncbi:MAG: PKD domain-containing protein [Cyclobacteriaceae bacterium]
MKQLFTKNLLLLLLSVLVLFSSCSDDDPLPASIADFEVANRVVEAWHPVKFSNLSINAATYEWDFGDGGTSDDPSPSHTFNAPGIYDVSLTAITEDGQTSTTIHEVKVGQRFFIGIDVLSFPDLNPEGANPDVVFMFLPTVDEAAEPGRGYQSISIPNIGKMPETSLPLEIPVFEGDNVPLTNQDYDLVVFALNVDTDVFNAIGIATLNPVTAPGLILARSEAEGASIVLYKLGVSFGEGIGTYCEIYLAVVMP